MIKIALCDDNLKSIQTIGKIIESILIEDNIDAEIMLVTDNQSDIQELIKENRIDILFLDVDFKNCGKNGIEFATQLRSINKDFRLIFLTAHFEYSLVSFKCKTFDYILKPISKSSLRDVLLRLKDDFSLESEATFISLTRCLCIRTNDILFIERKFNKSYVHTKDNTYVSPLALKVLLNKLPNNFERNHRAYITNKNAISKIDKFNKTIIFDSGNSCPLGHLNYNS